MSYFEEQPCQHTHKKKNCVVMKTFVKLYLSLAKVKNVLFSRESWPTQMHKNIYIHQGYKQ